jgi:hypothetical protein
MIPRSNRRYSFAVRSLAAVLLALACTALIAKSEDIPVDETADFRGKVTDASNKPMGHVKVTLTDKVTGESKSTSTNGNGQFWVSTQSQHPLSMQFTPPNKSGLASAFFESLPAREDRQLIVHLSKGFPVEGRLTFAGGPLKGLRVRILADNPIDDHERIYGGGETITGANGSFRLSLTPGHKQMFVSNDRYSNVTREIKRKLTVTNDLKLGDIDLSLPH